MPCVSLNRRLLLGGGLGLLCLALAAGCGSGNRPVNPDVARQTLQKTLEEWKGGAKPDALRQASPQIVVQDLDWSDGAQLTAFEILGDGKPVDANLIAQVKLTLRGKDGKEAEKTVTYVVGTSPVLTVFRDMMR